VDLAHDLKATWPIDQFLEQLLMVPLKPAGPNQWRGRCVSGLHEDRRPSMWVYGDDGHVHCYSCGLHGDVLDLTRLNFGLDSFAAAVEKLADVTVTWTGEEG
jgi:DNA primase